MPALNEITPLPSGNDGIKTYRIGASSEVHSISEINKIDQTAPRKEYPFRAPGFVVQYLEPLLKDKRDVPMLHLMFDICAVVFPCSFLLYLMPATWYPIGITYMILMQAMFLQRFILWLHFCSHIKTYTDKHPVGWVLNRIPQMILAPFFGLPPGCYYLHHVVMHHCENNLFPYDVSSTEPYNRGNIREFLFYWMRYLIALWVELPYYAFTKGRYQLMAVAIFGKLSYLSIVYYFLMPINSMATMCIFTIPFFFSSFALMFGNFSQHIFIDPADSRSNYKLTINVINCEDNMWTFNDGYHILHHINSKLHWTLLPQKFTEMIDSHLANNAFLFDGIGFGHVGFYVFTGQFGKLADRLIQLGDTYKSRDELIQLLKSRLPAIDNRKLRLSE